MIKFINKTNQVQIEGIINIRLNWCMTRRG